MLAGAIGGIGAVVAGAVAKVGPARGANNDPVLVGNSHFGDATTQITNATDSSTVFRVDSTANGKALHAESNGGIGVEGMSASSYAVRGYSSLGYGVWGVNDAAADKAATTGYAHSNGTGVLGISGTSIPAAKPKTGVYGYANQDSNSKGVWGFSGKGVGVYGKANKDGIALRANGRIKADKVSGVKTIPAGSTTATVSPGVNVSSGSFVLLTPKTNIGSRALWFTTQPAADTFKIRMSSSRSSNTRVAWLLLG